MYPVTSNANVTITINNNVTYKYLIIHFTRIEDGYFAFKPQPLQN